MKTSFDAIENVRKEMISLSERLGSLLQGIMGAQKEVEEEATGEQREESAVSEIQESEIQEKAEAPATFESATFESNGEAKKKPNQSELVREYFRIHGLDVRNKEVVEAIKKEKGVEVTPSLVSYLKSRLAASDKVRRKMTVTGRKKTTFVASASALIRDYLEKHGLDSSNEEVVQYIKRTRGVEARPTLVSSVRAIMKKKGFRTSKVSAQKKARHKGPTLVEVAVEILKKGPKSGMELSDVAEKALRSGYEYKGKKNLAGLTQNVYQALHTLTKTIPHRGFKGRIAVVKKEGHLYKLNPKAKVA